MTKIVTRKIPNAIGNSDVTDPVVRQKVMLLQENIQSLASQLSEAQKALVELQGGSSKANVDVSGLAVQVAPLVAQVVYEKTEEASGYADSASTSAANAETSASTAEQRVTSALNGVLSVETIVFDEKTISSVETITKEITKSGFVPVAISTVYLNTRYAYASRWYIETVEGISVAYMRISNIGNNDSINVTATITVLYAKTCMV